MKKVLIITYYWPPSGGGGVQRWVKFVKYLKEYGWEPIVFAPENPEYPILDESLLEEIPDKIKILTCKIWEPYKLYRLFSGNQNKTVSAGMVSNSKKKSTSKKIFNWIRGNFFIPDARKFWIKPASKSIIAYHHQFGFDAIISTGPPHSMHLIARKVQKRTGLKWLADFRDPWMNMDNEEELQYSKSVKQKHQKLENMVLNNADKVVTVSWHLSTLFSKQSTRDVGVLTNGFDPIDIENANNDNSIPNNKFIIGHYGTFGADRNVSILWGELKKIVDQNQDFKNQLVIELIGPTDISIIDKIEEYGLRNNLVHIPYLSHSTCISRMKRASILLVVLNQNKNAEGRVTGKIFEYIATSNTVLGIGSKTSDCAKVIYESNSGEMIDYHSSAAMNSFLLREFDKYKKEHLKTKETTSIASDKSREQFTRKRLTKNLAKFLDNL